MLFKCYRPKTVHKSVIFRAFRKIPVPAYQNDVKVVLNNQSKTPDNINDSIDYYNSTLPNLTDKFAPLLRYGSLGCQPGWLCVGPLQ